MKRKIKKYKNSDWLFITPKPKIRIMKLTTSYFYHPKRRIVVTLPMESHFYILIGRKGKDSANKIYTNKSGFVTPFTYVRKLPMQSYQSTDVVQQIKLKLLGGME